MTGRYSTTATALAFLIACNHSIDDAAQPSGDPSGDPSAGGAPSSGGDPSAGGGGSGSDAGPPMASCPLGAASWTRAIGFAALDQRSDIAVDAAGDVLFATQVERAGFAHGLTKLSPSGDVVFARPFGSVVATDRAGNTFIAGSFTEPLDVGLGVMQPEDNIDVFVAKLDAAGNVVFARPLRLCGDGVQSIAVDATGRIAVSGTAMGTAVLAPDGDRQFVLALSGDVAFNSHGDLIVAGTFTTTIDLGDGPISAGTSSQGFVIAVDRAGQRLWSHLLAGTGVHTNSVAVDGHDNVVLAGHYERSIDLFGDKFTAIFVTESGRVTGAYIAALDASGELLWKQGMAPGSEANGVATDNRDNAITAGASTGNAGFGRITQVTHFDTMGSASGVLSMAPASGYGRGMSVAVDACGSVYLTVNALDLPNPASALRAYVVKLSPR